MTTSDPPRLPPPRPPLPADRDIGLEIDLAMLADKHVDGYGQRAADRALRAQIQQAHNDKESWT